MPRYEFVCNVDPRGASEGKEQVPQLRKREGHPAAHGLHRQDVAEELTTKDGGGSNGLSAPE